MSLASSLRCCVEPISSLFKQCDPPDCCCGCCSALRPRYKRLVDNIFPPNPQDGLVRSNMEKLTFYALSAPEKLDRIGEYLAQKVSRDISRHKNGYVIIAMEAMDQLLIACHAQCLNLFVESFLKMVQRLLECHESELQLLATQSFVKFANIEEDTPSYHRRYDFFVSKFSSLCHNNHSDLTMRTDLRLAGLRGLQGVVRKTVSDDLQANIWDDMHMEKIVPSLLFNMQDHRGHATETPDAAQEDSHPWALAENCLREMTGRATYGHILSVLRPVFRHFDNHHLWVPNDFAVHTFTIIMYSIQAQYSFSVIQALMNHMDEKFKGGNAKVLSGIVNVLSSIVAIAAGESIGPSVLEIFNSLLNHLRNSIEIKTNDEAILKDEQHFQEAVINTLGEFANNLPDYQKIEIMMFILNKVPPPIEDQQDTDAHLQRIMLKSLLKVGTKYRTVQLTQAFPSSFLHPLLKMSLAPDPSVRLLVQQILHTLLDRHDNLLQLKKPTVDEQLVLNVEQCSRQDTMFVKKNGPDILYHVYENVQVTNNDEENFTALYTTLALICCELGSEDTLTELLRLIFAMQELPNTLGTLTAAHSASIHALAAGFMYLVAHLTPIPTLCSHIDAIIKARRESAPYLLPSSSTDEPTAIDDVAQKFLFDKAVVAEALNSSGHDTIKLLQPYMPRHGITGDAKVTRSISDLNAISVEVDSVSSSPGITRKCPEEEITVESLKKIMMEPLTVQKEQQNERRLQIVERFRTAAFEDLVAKTDEKLDLQNRLNEIFGRLPITELPARPASPFPVTKDEFSKQLPVAPMCPIQFPDFIVF